MKRVTWPSAKEVRAATIVVMVTLLVVSSYMGIVDWLLTLLFGTPVATGY
ncbi:MAG: preprotein translocase subunit SecE [Burkholderiales bacterium]|nr:preprotein translocase subunit SecE [Burkholderiales bacterium]